MKSIRTSSILQEKGFIVKKAKKTFFIFMAFIFIFSIGFFIAQAQQPQTPAKGPAPASKQSILKTYDDKLSYCIGLDIGENLMEQSIKINPDIMIMGIKDTLAGKNKILTEAEILETMTTFKKEMMAKQTKMMGEVSKRNKEEGNKFLSENKKKDGVKTTKSGLQYKVITEGTGKSPQKTDTVVVHYTGKLLNGTEFDSSFKRGEPVTFPVSGVIPGWTEALLLMKAGSKWELYIPSNLAYGEQGAGRVIGPNSTLHFIVELISIQEKK